MGQDTADGGRPQGSSLWDVVARWNPTIGTLGAVVSQWVAPWFGILIFAGIMNQLNSVPNVSATGNLSTAQLVELSRQGIVNPAVLVLNMGLAVVGITLLLLILLIHVFYVPPSAQSLRPPTGTLHNRIGQSLVTFHHRYYDTITVAAFILLFVLMWLGTAEWCAIITLVAFGVFIPVYAIRHATRASLTYAILLFLLGVTLVTYPYRFGRDFYQVRYVMLEPLTPGPFMNLKLRLEAPGPGIVVTSVVACNDQGTWSLEFPAEPTGDATRIERPKLTDLPFVCQDGKFIPSSSLYAPPPQ